MSREVCTHAHPGSTCDPNVSACAVRYDCEVKNNLVICNHGIRLKGASPRSVRTWLIRAETWLPLQYTSGHHGVSILSVKTIAFPMASVISLTLISLLFGECNICILMFLECPKRSQGTNLPLVRLTAARSGGHA